MKKLLFTTALSMVCFGVNASSHVCEYSTAYNIDVDKSRVLFSKKSGDKFEFQGESLFINGEKANLTSAQSQSVKKIVNITQQTIPKIADIAADATELALKATTLVMTSFFGEDQAIHQDLIRPIEILSDKIRHNIKVDSFNAEAMSDSFDDAFEKEFDVLMETAITKHSGKIVGNVISAIFSGDSEDLADFEFRMENMGQEIESYVEANAGDIEARAESLCQDFAKIDELDNQFQGVEGYPSAGLITQGKLEGFDVGSINLNF